MSSSGETRSKDTLSVTLTRARDVDEVRNLVKARRAAASSQLSAGALDHRRLEEIPPTQRLELLRNRLDAYQNVFDFDLSSPLPLLGRPLTLVKRFIRRALRSYIDRQTEFNRYCLALFAALHDEQSLRERASRVRIEQLEEQVAELEDIVDSLSIELRAGKADAAAAGGVDERAEKTNASR